VSPAPLNLCGDQSSRMSASPAVGHGTPLLMLLPSDQKSGPDSLVGEIGKIDPGLDNAVLEGLPPSVFSRAEIHVPFTFLGWITR